MVYINLIIIEASVPDPSADGVFWRWMTPYLGIQHKLLVVPVNTACVATVYILSPLAQRWGGEK
jgi:hypothetical protein